VEGPRIALRIGPISIAWYGIIIVGSAMLAAYLAEREAKRLGEDPEHVWNGLLWCLILGMVGARLYHVVHMWDHYRQYPMQIFDTRQGGLAIYGAVVGGAAALWLYTRANRLKFARWADIAAPGLVLAQALARWGNYLNQELYGFPTSAPWGIGIDAAHRIPPFDDLTKYPLDTGFHPTFLYESIGNLVNFALLIFISRRYADRLLDGDLILLYGVLYPLLRFLIEFQRPDAWMISGVATAQWIALASVLICGALLIYRHRSRSEASAGESESEA
jgi:phosphatidylglycerol:prolipoprotein diacylglycerol transferase